LKKNNQAACGGPRFSKPECDADKIVKLDTGMELLNSAG
jgi:hypothetical protein